ncbi:TATE DNA transposon [Trypanosoma theileri]|uniref:TATE DNA transposon n=1 Tax=Trypanosoma theileri TaxID=67003 RepID=A0A1X0NNC9_9TRYP|nr:TATE DNA transposon [Trypanosoma theileri]ORC85650.1 TATE DNA transposon [Trypanosoma theileri]
MMTLAAQLVQNPYWTIAEEVNATYNDEDYDVICFTDASADGWGAIVITNPPAPPRSENVAEDTWTPHATIYQQRWIHDFNPGGNPRPSPQPGRREEGTRQVPQVSSDTFNARHSAHAEPRAIHLLLQHLERQGVIVHGESIAHEEDVDSDVILTGPRRRPTRVAVVTDHFPIAHAQRRLNGFGGIGRGYALNRLFEYTNELFHTKAVQVVFFLHCRTPQSGRPLLTQLWGRQGNPVTYFTSGGRLPRSVVENHVRSNLQRTR